MTNNNLAVMVNNIITDNGIKKSWIADQLGISQQLLQRMLSKKNFTIDDANRILSPLGYRVSYKIEKVQ